MDDEHVELISELDRYREAKKIYDEFKRLRELTGKPLRKFVDPEWAEKDLRSDEFLKLIEQAQQAKGNEAKRKRKN